tara:strand:+ start:1437 stop:2024 length:588 start_codon:yes stop_codon:yes gene_type:complete
MNKLPSNITYTTIKISDNINHEGKYYLEKITKKGSQQFIKNYTLYPSQVNEIIEKSQGNPYIKIQLPSDKNEQKNNTFFDPNHPEYTTNNRLNGIDSYQSTLNAKFGDYRPEVTELKQMQDNLGNNATSIITNGDSSISSSNYILNTRSDKSNFTSQSNISGNFISVNDNMQYNDNNNDNNINGYDSIKENFSSV